MFIKKTKSKNYTYLQIVKSYRDSGKVKHKVVANLGRFDKLVGNPELIKMGNRLLELAGQQKEELSLEELGRLYYGHIVYKKLWDKFKLSEILHRVSRNNKIGFDIADVVMYLAIKQLLKPGSKYSSWRDQGNYLGLPSVELQHIYRSLDVLAQRKGLIEKELFNQHRNLFNLEVDIVFYDVTTFHFESTDEDILRAFGFSKAGKFNEVQVVMGMMVDQHGRPIGYELFEGNLFEGKTMLKAIEILKERYKIKKVIIVADKGLNSGMNLSIIKEAGYDYIVSSKLKSQTKKIKDEIFNPQDYIVTHVDEKTGEVLFQYKIIKDHIVKYKDENGKEYQIKDNVIVTWSSKRAKADFKKRQRAIDKANEMIDNNKTPSSKKGAKRYIKTEGKEKIIGIDEEKIKNDTLWDGYYGIQFSDPNISHKVILENYKLLWRIEESFKILKSTMEVRPIFHWTPQRIRGHFVLCFIAFLLERNLELILNKKKVKNLSVEKIKEALNTLQVSKVKLNDQIFLLRGKHNALAADILKAMNLKPIKNLSPAKI